MSIKEEIKEKIKEAMRSKDTALRDTLRNIQTMIKQIEVDERRELDDEEVTKLIIKYAKQRHEAMAQFQAASRDDLVQKEQVELDILSEYLPKQLNEEELRGKIQEIIAEIGATSMNDMGKIMGKAKEIFGNSADGSLINKIVKEQLSSKE
ncbi:MAG: GatB/YqeY domain-containing protein [Campylobacterales bacterium]|nr:GatB/YqeY domain-containing protein [Campylobacterales bacterium]